jgi:hypothetical protein
MRTSTGFHNLIAIAIAIAIAIGAVNFLITCHSGILHKITNLAHYHFFFKFRFNFEVQSFDDKKKIGYPKHSFSKYFANLSRLAN